MKLCALTDVKTMLDITDTTQDAKLNLMIEQASSFAVKYLGYNPSRKTYTSEKYAVNNRQYLQLSNQPVQSVTSVTIAGVSVTDFGTEKTDLDAGLLYRGVGWCGDYYVRGMADDVVSGVRDIAVTYVAGWYLPGDAEYTAGDDDSLPLDISAAITGEVVMKYRENLRETEGLKAHSEGGISDTYANGSMRSLSESTAEVLRLYARTNVA